MPSNQPTAECCCGICVHSGTRWTVSIALIATVILDLVKWSVYMIPFMSVRIFVCALLLYGVEKRRPNFYLPYLFVYILSLIVALVRSPFIFLERFQSDPRIRPYVPETMVISYIMLAIVLCPLVYLFVVIPYRSYRMTKFERDHENYPATYPTAVYVPAANMTTI